MASKRRRLFSTNDILGPGRLTPRASASPPGQRHASPPRACREVVFSLPDGELWRTAMINLPVFPVRTPEAFYEQFLASKPDPATGKPDPAKLQAFRARHPETVEALKHIEGERGHPRADHGQAFAGQTAAAGPGQQLREGAAGLLPARAAPAAPAA